MKTYVCIDIGGTSTRVQLWTLEKKVIAKTNFSTINDDALKNFEKIVEHIKDYQAKYQIQGIGISAPGPTDYENGIFFKLPNMPKWEKFEFKKYLKSETGIENIKAENDANLMALAHHYSLSKAEDDITQFFTISTGLGAGLIINNKIFNGSSHHAQEVAFAPTSWIPEPSPRFGKGALEYFASGSGIAERASSKYKTTKEVFDNYKNDQFAKKIIDDGINALSNMIATTLALINPSILVFDGSVARYNKWYVEAAIVEAKKNSMPNHFQNLRIYYGDKGDDAAIEGAFYLSSK